MAIVQGGKQFTKDDLLQTAGQLATILRNAIQQANSYKVQLESWAEADLITLGLTQEQINAQKGFYIGDLPAIYDAFANSAWVKQLLGTGL